MTKTKRQELIDDMTLEQMFRIKNDLEKKIATSKIKIEDVIVLVFLTKEMKNRM